MTWELALAFALSALILLAVAQMNAIRDTLLDPLMVLLILGFAAAAIVTGILWAVNA